MIAARAGRPVRIAAVSARNKDCGRAADLTAYRWVDSLDALAQDPEIDVVVEMIGGADGAALALAKASIGNGKSFVTANKAMIAHHGMALAHLAEEHDVSLKYEAAVAGGIPVIKGLREGTAANRIARVYGILNGTCNYILSTMEDEGRDFADVLADAQAMGFAEADPAFDIDGIDAAHKLAILTAISFGSAIDFDGVEITGIRDVLAADIGQARALGYRIRLLGMARVDANGGLFQRVHPYLVPEAHPLAHIDGATNAVVVEGNFSGRLMFQGAGAGAGPTASAVVGDIIDIALGRSGTVFSLPAGRMQDIHRAEPGAGSSKSYLRFTVDDRPGVLAEITAAMRDAKVSIESLIQTEKTDDGSVLIALVTHECKEANIADSLKRLRDSDSLHGPPMVMHLLGESD